MAACARDEGEAMDALDAAETQILSIAERAMRGGLQPVGKLVHEEVAHIERVSKSSAPYTGIETGYYRLDELTSGLQKQDLVILAARPGVGKTALALNIASHCAVKGGLKVAVFSLEMSAVALVRRLLAAEARINVKRLTRGLLSKSVDTRQEASDWQRLAEAADRLAEAPLWIDDTAGISILELRGKCRRMMMEHGLDLVVVDYLQLMSSGVRGREPHPGGVGDLPRPQGGGQAAQRAAARALAALAQPGAARRPAPPALRPARVGLDRAGCGRRDVHQPQEPRPAGRGRRAEDEEDWRLAEIIIAKQRNGPTDLFKLVFLEEFTRFENPEFSSYER